MTNNSSFYKKPSNQPPMRQFNVDDPSQMMDQPFANDGSHRELSPEERMRLSQMRQETPKLSDYAKKRSEILANIGRLTKDIEADGITFSLKTLKAKEQRESTLPMFKCLNDIDAGFELRRQTLARSIYAIDGQDMAMIVGGNDIELRLDLVDELEDTINILLYNACLALKSEVLSRFTPKTSEEAKGVLEDLKK